MADAGKITRLTNLDTRGVAVVKRGANNKRFAIAKTGDDVTSPTIEEMFLRVIEKGDMPFDEAAIDEMCKNAGCDPQMAETVKAIMKLKHVYRDNDAFMGVVKQLLAGGEGGAQPPAAGAQPGAGVPPGAKPGAEGEEPPAAADKDKPAGEEPAAPQKEPAGDGDKPPPFGKKPDEGDSNKEPPMSDKEKEEAQKAIAKAAELETIIKAQAATIETQKTALDANTQAVKKMQDDLRKSQWVTKAEKDLSFVTGKTAEELGQMLFDIDTLNPDMAKSQFEMLKAQSTIVKSSNLFRPSGANGGAPAGAGASAYSEAEKRADAIVSKSAKEGDTPEVAKARAMNAVFKADPSLYKRYCDEMEQDNQRQLSMQGN